MPQLGLSVGIFPDKVTVTHACNTVHTGAYRLKKRFKLKQATEVRFTNHLSSFFSDLIKASLREIRSVEGINRQTV